MTSKEWIKKELNSLKEFLDQTNAPVVFAHNDLLPANILYDKEEDHVWFIDYEYASYNYRGFDIGNHFCEFAGTRSPLQWEAYPSKAEQMEFLRAYLGEPNTCQFSHVGGETDAEHELERLYVEANQFSLAAHLFWGTWAFVQSETSDIDYDYMGYGLARLGEYLNRKHEFLSLQLTLSVYE
ncbi:probable ethanolamine kinase [Zophobas morio]|uniref:probable ethanolamine kinase n=1 Tax=Zophobas morio TaxID=2755281 RepID=UPI003082B98D